MAALIKGAPFLWPGFEPLAIIAKSLQAEIGDATLHPLANLMMHFAKAAPLQS
jgi:hypothetical protein